ncbi:CRE-HPR-17 protein [Aphelenchoides avenae]|nr:CRE-HPR-17 protein [Aphelenchus avenae]
MPSKKRKLTNESTFSMPDSFTDLASDGSFSSDTSRSHFARPVKRRNSPKRRLDEDLANKHAPTEESELAVHATKISEVNKWLRAKMAECGSSKGLLLTGPPGCGKSTTVKVLCAELGIEVLEFDATQHEYELSNTGDELWETSVVNLFVQFLRRAEFVSIEKQCLTHRLLLIEQLPNVFYRDPEKFRAVMLNNVRASRCLIVFALSNVDRCWDLHPMRLFTADVLDACCMTHIKFNSVANTLMHRAVKRVLGLIGLKPSASVVGKITEAAGGDIRAALNAIEYSQTGSKLLHADSVQSPKHLDFFHFIGKLLYAKRAEAVDDKWTRAESLLRNECRHLARDVPPKDDLNELLASSFMSGANVAGYVFEHEPKFTNDLKALKAVVDDIAHFNTLLASGEAYANPFLDKYLLEASLQWICSSIQRNLQVSARTVIYHNYKAKESGVRHGYYQLSKFKQREMTSTADELQRKIVETFPFARSTDLQSLVLPIVPFTDFPMTAKQIQLVRTVAISLYGPTAQRISSRSPCNETYNSFGPSQLTRVGDVDTEDGFSYDIEEVDD